MEGGGGVGGSGGRGHIQAWPGWERKGDSERGSGNLTASFSIYYFI